MSKSEKREMRQQKKINAARNRQARREQCTNDAEETPFMTKSHIRAICAKFPKEEDKLFQYSSIAMYRSDVDHLLPGEWLNDNNLSFIYEMITESVLKPNELFRTQIHMLFPSVVHLFMHFPDPSGVLPLEELEKSRFIFIPANFTEEDAAFEANSGDHWSLCVYSALETKLYVYDSMAVDDDTMCDTFVQNLSTKLTKTFIKRPITIQKMKCDQQTNFDDCGVFLVMITCLLVQRLTSGNVIDMNIDNVKFRPMRARYEMLHLIHEMWRAQRNEE